MKRKCSTALAVVMVLMLLTASAVAATILWKDAGEKVAPMEKQNGYYEDWNADAKVALVQALSDLGELRDNPDAQRLLTADLTDEDKNALADQIMTVYVNGTADTVTLTSILEKLHGDMSTWSMEDRVWYNGLLAENGMLTAEDMPYALPAGVEMTQQQAVDAAKAFLERISGATLDGATVEATMYQEPDDRWSGDLQTAYAGRRVWSVIFRRDEAASWHVDLTANGEVILYDRPEFLDLLLTGLLPDEGAISEAQAISLAKEAALGQLGLSESDLTGARAYYGYINHMSDGHAPLGTRVWQIVFGNGSRVMLSHDGSVLYTEK